MLIRNSHSKHYLLGFWRRAQKKKKYEEKTFPLFFGVFLPCEKGTVNLKFSLVCLTMLEIHYSMYEKKIFFVLSFFSRDNFPMMRK
jgi:hypothetical protein